MKDGFNISGLTSAASIWASSVIGIMIGVGFYAASILLAISSAICMMWGPKLESWLPSRQAVSVLLRYKIGFIPSVESLRAWMQERGFSYADGSLSVSQLGKQAEWRFVVIDTSRSKVPAIHELARDLGLMDGVEEYQLSHARN